MLPRRNAFHPVPGVDSAVAEFILRADLDDRLKNEEEAPFIAFIDAAFAMKRKTLVNNLKSWRSAGQIEECLQACGLPAQIRAEALGIDDLIPLFRCVHAPGQIF